MKLDIILALEWTFILALDWTWPWYWKIVIIIRKIKSIIIDLGQSLIFSFIFWDEFLFIVDFGFVDHILSNVGKCRCFDEFCRWCCLRFWTWFDRKLWLYWWLDITYMHIAHAGTFHHQIQYNYIRSLHIVSNSILLNIVCEQKCLTDQHLRLTGSLHLLAVMETDIEIDTKHVWS